MTKPSRLEEKKLWKLGYRNIAGLDEAGRGAWAGPIVAAAVILPPRIRLEGLRDSKQLSPGQREKLFSAIAKVAISWSVGIVSHRLIDRKGIGPANILAMVLAIKKLSVAPDYLLIDALKFDHLLPSQAIVRGDQKVFSIAAASILAKVTRDRILIGQHEKLPQYDFHLHKGYGTKHHLALIKKHGVSQFHRKSYRPMKHLIV
ncbi:MAG: ribonuclease HII [Patescibacteria group bacterium]|nr:ribonuclease HII [Patescibacteria group bacterium]